MSLATKAAVKKNKKKTRGPDHVSAVQLGKHADTLRLWDQIFEVEFFCVF